MIPNSPLLPDPGRLPEFTSVPAEPLAQRRRRWLAWGVVLAGALFWRLLGITQNEVWRDEAITILHTRCGWRELLTRLWQVEDSPPLGFLVFKVWSLVSADELWLRCLSVGCGVLAVLVMMGTAERIRRGAGVWAGLLAGLAPVHVHYSQEIRAYSLLFLLVVLCFWGAERWLGDRRPRWIVLLGVCASLAGWIHAVGLFVFPMVCLSVVIRAGRAVVRRPAMWGCLLWISLIWPVVLFAVYWSRVHQQAGDWWLGRPDAKQFVWLGRRMMGLGPLDEWVDRASLARMWVGFGVERAMAVSVALLFVLGLLNRETRRAVLALAASGLLYVGLLVAASVAALPNIMDRTLLAVLCPIVLVLGVGSVSVPRVRALGLAAVLGVAVIWAFGWGWTIRAGAPRRMPSVAVYEFMRERLRDEDRVFSSPAWLEDLSIYRLGDRVRGEHFLSDGNPVYRGLPARHSMVARLPDPDWRKRLTAEMGEPAFRTDASIWVVSFGAGGREVLQILAESGWHVVAESRLPEAKGMWVMQYRPASPP